MSASASLHHSSIAHVVSDDRECQSCTGRKASDAGMSAFEQTRCTRLVRGGKPQGPCLSCFRRTPSLAAQDTLIASMRHDRRVTDE